MQPIQHPHKLSNTPEKSPQFGVEVKDKDGNPVTCADPKANRTMVALMDQQAVNGGAASHWGGPAGCAEIVSAIHALMFQAPNWTESFNFVNDIGHAENGIYAVRANYGFGGLSINDLKGFRSIESHLTGHGESHLYSDGVLLSNGPLGSSVAQAQGLALADRLSGRDRKTICVVSDGACMEGESKEAFAAIAGLAKRKKLAPFLLVISDNDTKLSGRISEDSFSMRPTFLGLRSMGWNVDFVESGNDLQEVYEAMETALEQLNENPDYPVALVVKTTKGKGVASCENSASGGHGYPLKKFDPGLKGFIEEIWEDQPIPEVFGDWISELEQASEPKSEKSASAIKSEKVQVGISEGLIECVKEGYPVYSLSSDLAGSTGLKKFQPECPDRYLDVGIAESNMVSAAAGLARSGFIPVVDTFAAFGITKGNLPLIMANLSCAPVISVFSHTGFQDAADGASHQSTTYFSAVNAIPHTQAFILSSSLEAKTLVKQVVKEYRECLEKGEIPMSTVFFLGRENFPAALEGIDYTQSFKSIEQGHDCLIVASGPQINQALEAQKQLKEQGVGTSVVLHSHVSHPPTKEIGELLTKCKGRLVTMEDHQITGGVGAHLLQSLALAGCFPTQVRCLGQTGHFGRSAYTAGELYQKFGMDAAAAVKAVGEICS